MSPLPNQTTSPRLRGLDPRAVVATALDDSPVGSPAPELAGYVCERLLGEGGLGLVWRARRVADDQLVAVKVPRFGEAIAEERLRTEAASLSKLAHPHIVALQEVTECEDERPALVMELVEGGNLSARIPPQGLPQEEALAIFRKIAEGVAAAHRQNVLHRDLKPSNVLLTPEGDPKVADFGLALPLEKRHQQFSLTMSGQLAGTVEYVAPETYRPGAPATRKADIYALGVMLYEMLTGAPPRGAWKPAAALGRVDVRLDELITEAIDPDPAKRPASVEEMIARLDVIASTPPRYDSRALVTRGLRWGDFFWSVLGTLLALFCLSGFLNLIQADTILPLGFFHGYGKVIEALLVVHFASYGLAGLMLWIIWRARRLQPAPAEDRLPLPFGWRPSSARLLGMLRAVVLVVILGWPLFFYLDYGWWLRGQWEAGVLTLQTNEQQPLGWWSLNPKNPFPHNQFANQWKVVAGEKLWIEDSTAYWPFVAPLLMVGALAIQGAGLVTLGMIAASWMKAGRGRWHWGVALPLGVLGTAVALQQWPEPHESKVRAPLPVPPETAREMKAFFTAFRDAQGRDDMDALSAFFMPDVMPVGRSPNLAEQLEVDKMDYEERWPVAEYRYGRAVSDGIRSSDLALTHDGAVRAVLPVEYHATHRSRSGQGGLAYSVYHLRQIDGAWKITRQFFGTDVLYVTPGPPPDDEASLNAFADAWCAMLGERHPQRRVADFYRAHVLYLEARAAARVRSRVSVGHYFRRLAAAWPERRFTRAGPLTRRLLPGMRLEVSFPVAFHGTSADGRTHTETGALTWHLLHLDGRWRILITPQNHTGLTELKL